MDDISGNLTQTTLIYPIIPYDNKSSSANLTSYSLASCDEPVDISQNQHQYTNILLIDNTVPSYQTFVDSVNPETFPVVYSKDCSSNELIELLRNTIFTGITRIGMCFVSPGNTSAMFLDNAPLFVDDSTEPYSDNVRWMIDLITEFSIKNIDFLACDTLNYSVWQNYYDLLTQTTGVIVGASDNKTGNIKYGGDWILESTSQDIEYIYFTKSIEYYSYLLDNLNWVSTVVSSPYALATDDTYIYVGSNNLSFKTIVRIPISTGVPESWVSTTCTWVWQMVAYNGFLYLVGDSITGISKISLTSPYTTTAIAQIALFRGICQYNGNLYVSDFTSKIYKYSVSGVLDTSWNNTGYVTVPTPNQLVAYNGYLYVISEGTGAPYYNTYFRLNINNVTDISYNFRANGSLLPLSRFGAIASNGNYIYCTDMSTIAIIDLDNLTNSNLTWKTGLNEIEGLVYSNYVVYASAHSVNKIVQYNLPIPQTVPINSVSFDTGNTRTIASGNLKLSVFDPSNTAANGVYYEYSVNGGGYINSNVNAGTSPNSVYVLSTDISNTILVRAKNTAGNSTPISIKSIIYNKPTVVPATVSLSLVSSGNVQVSITESSPVPYYYLNNIYYICYPYPNYGTNLSNNINAYTSNVGILANTNATYSTVVSYVNGLSANTYTFYVKAANQFGNTTTTVSRNISVYTTQISTISLDIGNTFIVSPGNLKTTINDPSNISINGLYYYYSADGGMTYSNTNIPNNGPTKTSYSFFIAYSTTVTQTIYIKAQNSIGNSNIIGLNVNSPANASLYIDGNVQLQSGITRYSFTVSGLSNKPYGVYLRAKNAIGYSSNSMPYSVTVYMTPTATVTIDSGNTKTVASGNLQVRLIDLSNTSLNAVSYQYAINGTSYINSNVLAGTSPYTFYIAPTSPALDISNTIYVRATNTVGNSSPAANLQVIVYQTPRQPPQVTFQLVQSGNVRVSIIESATTPIPYYYLNNVSYYLYAYNNANGTNLSGNTSLLVYNKPVGVLSNTDATYGNVVSYVNTGLTANTYTMYLIATNSFGNSIPYYANINVYTTPDYPPKIDIGNTISATSGNLTVSFTDSSNNTRNAISYWYYVYDSSAGTNNSGNISYYANSTTVLTTGAQQSFPLYGFTNKTYTLYLLSRNVVGNSSSSFTNVTVYTVPTDILIDTANVRIVSSGNLQVLLVDPYNGTNNGVYYQYSINGVNGNAYSNSNAQSIGNNTYRFYISGLSNATYTINVVAKNTVGTSNANTFSQLSYVIPQYPPIIDQANTLSKTSGNLIISFTDISNVALNNITYSYYLYDPSPPYTNIAFI